MHKGSPASALARVALLALVPFFVLSAPDAGADDVSARITLGEVSAAAAPSSWQAADVATLMRGAAQHELAGLPANAANAAGAKKRVIVSLALVRMETTPVGAGASVECAVSATLRTARDGALFAILEGRARAEGGGSHEALESDAIRAAVKGTMARIPNAIALR